MDIGDRCATVELGAISGVDSPFIAAVCATPMPIVITDPRLPDNPMVFVNDAFCRLTGYPRDEIVGRNCRFLQGPETDPATIARIRAAVRGAEPIKIDLRNHRKDGAPFWNRLLMAPVRDVDDTLLYFIASQVDVTIEHDRVAGLEVHNAALLNELAGRLRAQQTSEARLRFATDAGRLGIWELELATRVLTASAIVKEICGAGPADDLSYDDLLLAIHPEDRAQWAAVVEQSIATGSDYEVECRLLRPGGAVRWMMARAQVMRGADGAAICLAGVLLDTTQRRSAELRLELSEESLRLATEAAEIGTWDLDVVTGTLAWSDRGKVIVGILPEQPYCLSEFYDGVHPEDRGAVEAAFNRTLDPAIRAPYEAEYRLVSPADGAVRWVAAKGRGVFNAQGRCVRAIGTAIDISARRAADRLAERDRAWRNSQDLLCVVDTAGTFRAANPAWTNLLGWLPDEVVGRHYLTLGQADDWPASETAVARLMRGDLLNHEGRLRHKDGTFRWFTWVTSHENGLIYASGRHITPEKEAAAALARAEEQLRQSQKMEAVGQLTGGIAHDFNNLLTGISGALELIQRRIAAGRFDDLERYAEVAIASAGRAGALTQRLLAFARRQPLDPKPLDTNRLVAGMEELLQRTLGPSVALELVLDPALWPTLCDPNQLENALLNLAINARDAITGTGRLTIETRNAQLDEAYARSHDGALRPGQYVTIAVTDTGDGMDPATAAKVFDPFFTTKPAGQGTGLGLSMLYGFIKQSDGHVRLHSVPGHGITFRLYLPRHAGSLPDDAADVVASLAPPRAVGETILVVDDEAAVRMVVAEVLADLGYTVIEAADGAAGMAVLRSDAALDLLVSDIGLPAGLNGRQLADTACALRPGLQTLFITGFAGDALVGGARSGSVGSGAVMLDQGMHILAKPFTAQALAAKVRGLLDRTP